MFKECRWLVLPHPLWVGQDEPSVKAKMPEGDGYRYQIGNNHGKINGWTTLDKIFGKVIAVED